MTLIVIGADKSVQVLSKRDDVGRALAAVAALLILTGTRGLGPQQSIQIDLVELDEGLREAESGVCEKARLHDSGCSADQDFRGEAGMDGLKGALLDTAADDVGDKRRHQIFMLAPAPLTAGKF